MDTSVQEAMNNYYKLKQTYDEKLMRRKRRILQNPTLSQKDKRLKLKQIKKNCIHCKKQGGTIFGTEKRIITAICGSPTPCKLNIRIDRGEYENIRTRKIVLFHELQNIHSDIIKTKLDLLFNYMNEDSAIANFEIYRQYLDILSKNYTDESQTYIEITHPESRISKLKEDSVALFIEKEKLHELHKLYNQEPLQKYIDAMVDIYINVLQPLARDMREIAYSYSSVEKVSDITTGDTTNKLIEIPYTLSQLYNAETKDTMAKIIINEK